MPSPFAAYSIGLLKALLYLRGKKKATAKQHGFKRKVPVSIDPKQGTYAFPTHTPTSYHRHWISLEHILRLTLVEKASFNSF